MCLTPVEKLTPEQIRQIRLREQVSQFGFRPLSECAVELGEPVGARRKASAWGFAQTTYARRAEGITGSSVN